MMRTIREELEYAEAIKALRLDYRRLDEAVGILSDALCVHPELFPALPGYRVHCAHLVGFPGVPELSIFFTYDDDYVYLMSADQIPEDE
jgi:hypothetical protein